MLALVSRLRDFTVQEACKSSLFVFVSYLLLSTIGRRGTTPRKGHAHFVRVLSDSRPLRRSSSEHYHQGIFNTVLFGRHVRIPHYSSPVPPFAEAAFRWRKDRQARATSAMSPASRHLGRLFVACVSAPRQRRWRLGTSAMSPASRQLGRLFVAGVSAPRQRRWRLGTSAPRPPQRRWRLKPVSIFLFSVASLLNFVFKWACVHVDMFRYPPDCQTPCHLSDADPALSSIGCQFWRQRI
jgi:hypothetical protein